MIKCGRNTSHYYRLVVWSYCLFVYYTCQPIIGSFTDLLKSSDVSSGLPHFHCAVVHCAAFSCIVFAKCLSCFRLDAVCTLSCRPN